MKNDEKKCPLTGMTCYGDECAWWHITDCAAIGVLRNLNSISMELFHARTELGYICKDLEKVEWKL